jgi:predicted helicase
VIFGGNGSKKSAADGTLESIRWRSLKPATPFYLFVPQDAEVRDEYQRHHRLTEIFPVNVLGFQTHRDAFAVSFTKLEMEQKLKELADPRVSDDDLERCYGLKSNRDWSLTEARAAARTGVATEPRLVAYRPFDNRWAEFSSLTMDYPRRELLDHVAGRANITLLAPRGIGTKEWRHALVADTPANDCVISNRSREANQVFPLYCFDKHDTQQENLSLDFRAFLDARYKHHYAPEEILGYIYAVLHASIYRKSYVEFLRIDFPRVPFPESAEDFEALSSLGWGLVQAHFLREFPRRKPAAGYYGKGNHAIESVRYSPEEQAIWINKTQCFKPVPVEVWEFHMGGYQVLDKYLKSRKDRTLSLDEINHVAAIVDSLAFTIEQMAVIDSAYRAAFPEQD